MIEGQASGERTPKLRYGMIGGGQGAFIGDVHRKAVAMDGKAELVCGAFSQSHDNTLTTGDTLGLPRERLYQTFEEMIKTEAGRPDRPSATLSRGRDPMSARAQSLSRLPSGHPEGYFEGFANVYSTFITALAKKLRGEALTADDLDFPGVEEGVQGVKYTEKCVESSAKGAIWLDMGT